MAALQSVKKGKNYEVFSDGTQKLIMLKGIRLSYPAFGKQKVDTDENGKERKAWQGVAMLPKDTHVEAKDAFVEIMNELMKANDVKIPPEYRCIKNGDDKENEDYANHWVINFSDSNRRPAVRDENNRLMIDPQRMHDPEYVNSAIAAIDEKFYGGCWADVMLRPWYFNGKTKNSPKTYPKRISCGFTGARFVKDDKPFGNGRIDDSAAWGDAPATAGGDDGFGDDDGL